MNPRILFAFRFFLATFFFILISKDLIADPKKVEEAWQPPKGLKVGAFVDTYYNQNFNQPKSNERAYTTQAVRNQEFNINLAHADLRLDGEKFRGRLAIQFGNSVNTNYSGEPTKDVSSNQFAVRNIQEGFVGVRLSQKVWLDAGIYFGHIGHESWISQKNNNYTRAYALDYVPYYSSGARLTYQYSNQLSFQFHVMNGWQNITENNKDKSLGFQTKYAILPNLTFTANYFAGNEAPTAERKQNRFYQNLITEWKINDRFTFAFSQDIGWQWQGQSFDYNPIGVRLLGKQGDYLERSGRAYRHWYQGNIWVSVLLSPDYRLSFRFDRMIDREQVLAQTKTPNGFNASAYILTLDFLQWNPALFRIELVRRSSIDPLFEYRNTDEKSKQETLLIGAISFLLE